MLSRCSSESKLRASNRSYCKRRECLCTSITQPSMLGRRGFPRQFRMHYNSAAQYDGRRSGMHARRKASLPLLLPLATKQSSDCVRVDACIHTNRCIRCMTGLPTRAFHHRFEHSKPMEHSSCAVAYSGSAMRKGDSPYIDDNV
jgi:hypothetical protein